jgi:hypothetical protein
MLNLLNDPVPKVRNCAAWVFYKLAEHAPEVVFSSGENFDMFMNLCINRLEDHHRISILLFSTLKVVFE